MAEIQIAYREYYCLLDSPEHCMQCHTAAAEDMGCRNYDDGEKYRIREDGARVIPFGDCYYARIRHIYKGLCAKNYTIEPFEDTYNPHLNCMNVTVGKSTYDCDRVILNGECIYNDLIDNEGESSP